MQKDSKLMRLLRMARLLSDTAPEAWRVRDLSVRLGVHPRSVYRYLIHLDPLLPIRQEGRRYWIEARCSLSDVALKVDVVDLAG